MSTDDLLAEALRLTRVDRARVAEELLSSLEESDEEVATAWSQLVVWTRPSSTSRERRSSSVAHHFPTTSVRCSVRGPTATSALSLG